MDDVQGDAAVLLLGLRLRWQSQMANHLDPLRQERLIVSWVRLHLIDKYAKEFSRQKRTVNMSHVSQREYDPPEDEPVLSELERGEIARLIERLPARQKQIVKLLLYEGRTQHEVAKIIGISQTAISVNFATACERLRTMLSPPIQKVL